MTGTLNLMGQIDSYLKDDRAALKDELTRLRTENADLRATLKQAREALEHLNNVYSGDSDLIINAIAAIDKVQP